MFCLCMLGGRCHRQLHAHFPLRVRLGAQTEAVFSKKSPTGPKPEYLIARSQLSELGFGPIQFLIDFWDMADDELIG